MAHCRTLVEILAARGVTAAMLTGDLPAADRRKVVEALNGGQVKVLVATGKLINESFDCRELSTLFLATPITFNGRLIQYLERVLRPAPGKVKATVSIILTSTCLSWKPRPGRGNGFMRGGEMRAKCKEDDPRKEALPGRVKKLQ